MYFFTADEHYGHRNIIKGCNRPFLSVEEMNEEIIKRHNEVVGDRDIVVHAGDFTLNPKKSYAYGILHRLNGEHICLAGSHDRWLPDSAKDTFQRTIDGQFVFVCHYAMRVWHRSHWNSWQLYGHSHGHLEPIGKQWDIGVDNNNFYPVSFEQVKKIMESRPDNPNLIVG